MVVSGCFAERRSRKPHGNCNQMLNGVLPLAPHLTLSEFEIRSNDPAKCLIWKEILRHGSVWKLYKLN